MVEKYVRSGVLEASLTVFQQWVSREFAKYGDNVLTTALLRNAADMRSFADLSKREPQPSEQPVFGERNKKLVYPFMAMTIGAFEIDAFKAGLKPKRYTNGQMIGKDKEAGKAYFEDYIPVTLAVGAVFETDSLDHVIAYATMLFRAAPRVTLVIEAETGFKTEIGVQIEPTLTIPQSDFSTPGDPFKFEHTFVISSYVGIASEMPLIKHVTVNARVGSTSTDDVFSIQNLPAIQLQKLSWYELFDPTHPNYKYNYQEEHDK